MECALETSIIENSQTEFNYLVKAHPGKSRDELIAMADSVALSGDQLHELCMLRSEGDPLEGLLRIRELMSKRQLIVYQITPSQKVIVVREL